MMKRICIIFSFLLLWGTCNLNAQHYVGVRAGYGNGSIRIFPPTDSGALWGLYNGGVSYKYYSREKYLGGIEIDFQYIQKGYRQPDMSQPDTVYTHWVNSMELPFFWQPHIYVMNRNMRVFLNLGVVFSYNINAYEELASLRDGPFYAKRPYDMQLVRDNRWGYGLCAGAGFNYIINRFEVTLEARYNFGYSDIYKNRNKYASNPLRSPMDNFYMSMGAYYRLGKGGILSSPSKKAAKKLSERESARVVRQADKQKGAKEVVIPAPESVVLPLVEPDTLPVALPNDAPLPEKTPENQEKPIENGNDTPAQGS